MQLGIIWQDQQLEKENGKIKLEHKDHVLSFILKQAKFLKHHHYLVYFLYDEKKTCELNS